MTDTLRHTPPGAEQFRMNQSINPPEALAVDGTLTPPSAPSGEMASPIQDPFSQFSGEEKVIAEMHHRVATSILEGYLLAGHPRDEAVRYVETYLQSYPRIPRPSYDDVKMRIDESKRKTHEPELKIPEINGQVITAHNHNEQSTVKNGDRIKKSKNRNEVIQDGESNATTFAQWGEIYTREKKTTNAWTNPKHKVRSTHNSKGSHKGTGRYSSR